MIGSQNENASCIYNIIDITFNRGQIPTFRNTSVVSAMGTDLHEFLVYEDVWHLFTKPIDSYDYFGDHWLGLTDNGNEGHWFDIFEFSWNPYFETYLPWIFEEIFMENAVSKKENCLATGLATDYDWFAAE